MTIRERSREGGEIERVRSGERGQAEGVSVGVILFLFSFYIGHLVSSQV